VVAAVQLTKRAWLFLSDRLFAIENEEKSPSQKDLTMPKRSWAYLIGLILICSMAGTWYYYKSKCHGVDECAAQSAEGHERDTPREPR
jgi:hypothetical protein